MKQLLAETKWIGDAGKTCAVLVAAAVFITTIIKLPQRVDAIEEKNLSQDERLNKLILLQEMQRQQQAPQQQMQQQYDPPAYDAWIEVDEQGHSWCTDGYDYWRPDARYGCY